MGSFSDCRLAIEAESLAVVDHLCSPVLFHLDLGNGLTYNFVPVDDFKQQSHELVVDRSGFVMRAEIVTRTLPPFSLTAMAKPEFHVPS